MTVPTMLHILDMPRTMTVLQVHNITARRPGTTRSGALLPCLGAYLSTTSGKLSYFMARTTMSSPGAEGEGPLHVGIDMRDGLTPRPSKSSEGGPSPLAAEFSSCISQHELRSLGLQLTLNIDRTILKESFITEHYDNAKPISSQAMVGWDQGQLLLGSVANTCIPTRKILQLLANNT